MTDPDPFYEELCRKIDRDFWITIVVIVIAFIPLFLVTL